MHFHWQNLNDKPGGRQGSPLRHGRAWWNVTERAGVNWSWNLWGHFCGIKAGLTKREEVGVRLFLAFPPIAFWVTVYGGPFAWLARALTPKEWKFEDPGDREISVSVHSWAIWWTIWRDNMGGWSRKVPRWRKGNFKPIDFLFGRTKHSQRELHSEQAIVPMPERGYRATVTLSEGTWRRPRWPFVWRRWIRAEVKMADGEQIPHPGKGENSWDCGEDATYSLITPAKTVEEAIAAMVKSVMRSRRRYGGSAEAP